MLVVARLEHVFERTADATPGATAIEHEGRATSYADLDARANQLAHVLADHAAALSDWRSVLRGPGRLAA